MARFIVGVDTYGGCTKRHTKSEGQLHQPARCSRDTSDATLMVASRRLTLAVLLSVFAVNFTDRQLLAILIEPIKLDLTLSDTQVGLLYGFSFAVLYTTAGLPIAIFADRANRARIINWSLVFFSLMTVACGLAAGYWQLLTARIGVAIGEAGTNPPSHSMISDLYPVGQRSTAMAIFALGPHIGILLGFLIGGWVGQLWGWRAAFVVAGVAGLLFAILSFGLLQEPLRSRADGVTVAQAPPARTVLQSLFRHASARHLFAGAGIFSVASYAVVGWLPSFLIRGHGFSAGAAGSILALVLGVVGGGGTVLGGLFADRLGARNAAWRLRTVAIALLVMSPCWAMVFLEIRTTAMLVVLFIPGALLGFYLGPTFAMVQSLAEPTFRATAAALLLLVINLVGLGLGPLAVGLLSDALQPNLGPDSLSFALLLVPPVCIWAAYHFHAAACTIDGDLANTVHR
jgi:predicted MFS family arabinose efflux permease